MVTVFFERPGVKGRCVAVKQIGWRRADKEKDWLLKLSSGFG